MQATSVRYSVMTQVFQPSRIQRQRTKGYRTPENTVYVGRPTKYGNPFSVADYGRDLAVELYQSFVSEYFTLEEIRSDLKGRNLSCWCPLDQACHADVLLKLANLST